MAASREQKRRRTCIACGCEAGKNSLYRIVRTPEGEVEFDPSGRAAGRGAYVCSMKCLIDAFSKKRVQRALKTGIDEAEQLRIIEAAVVELGGVG